MNKLMASRVFKIKEYLELVNNLDVNSTNWQKKFNTYYNLRLKPQNLAEIIKHYNVNKHKGFYYLVNSYQGRCAVVFSKLLATENANLPIIDKNVSEFFGRRINTPSRAKSFYADLQEWYKNYLKSSMFKKYDKWFVENVGVNVSDYKKVDLLLWLAGGLDEKDKEKIVECFLKGYENL